MDTHTPFPTKKELLMFESHAFNEDCECAFCTGMREIISASPFNPITDAQYAGLVEALHRTWVPGKEKVSSEVSSD